MLTVFQTAMVIPVAHTGSDRPGTPTDHPPKPARMGRIFDIKRFSAHDGPGIRSTVFLTGCPLRCAWCHNPEAFACDEVAAGDLRVREITVDSLVRELERDLAFFDRSGGGVTISGGEPLFQADFTIELLRSCRTRELHAALDTSGCADPAVLTEAASLANLVLYDLKAMDTTTHARWTGVGNRRILENLLLLDGTGAEVWIRMPLVPGCNDDGRNLDEMTSFLSKTRFRRISILPFHRIASAKYRRLGLPERMAGVEPPSPGRIEEVRQHFAAAGFDPHIGS
jgi:pyruvate formate lyase activating enzyme